jgi:MFS family permease
MGRMLVAAVLGHAIGILATIFAPDFWTLFFATLVFGIANGFVEAACNPLIATLYPEEKIKRLNLFHVWFPGGIVIGGLASYAITQGNIGGDSAWKIKFGLMLIPLAVYAAMFLGRKFPQTERQASGVSTGAMFQACLRPFFLLFVICMLMTAITELGPQQWFPNILTLTTGIQGILFLVWITGLMAVGRMFAGPVVHTLSPVGLLIASSVLSAIGLYSIAQANSAAPAFVAATIFALGVCFFWPTMLGVVNERFPKTGALGLAVMGGAGSLSSGLIQPIIGATYDRVAAQSAGMTMEQYRAAAGSIPPQALAEGGRAALLQVVALPIILTVIFTGIFLYDRARGGYQREILIQHQEEPDESASSEAPA